MNGSGAHQSRDGNRGFLKLVRCRVATGVDGVADTVAEVRVEQGLIGGEDLIVNPPATLKDGDRVRRKA